MLMVNEAVRFVGMLFLGESERPWYIFPCRNGQVALAQQWFEGHPGHSCEYYYPVARRYVFPKRARTDAPTIVERPAFGRYLFIRSLNGDEQSMWRKVYSNHHLHRHLTMLCMETEEYIPTLVSNEDIARIRKLEARGFFDDATPEQQECTLSQLLHGRPVRIPYGQFVGTKGAKLECIKRKLAIVKIVILGKDILLTFPFEDIFPDFQR